MLTRKTHTQYTPEAPATTAKLVSTPSKAPKTAAFQISLSPSLSASLSSCPPLRRRMR